MFKYNCKKTYTRIFSSLFKYPLIFSFDICDIPLWWDDDEYFDDLCFDECNEDELDNDEALRSYDFLSYDFLF